MSVIFDKEKNIFHLKTPNSSYIFMIYENRMPIHLYYGGRIDNTDGIEETVFIGKIKSSVIDSEYADKDISTEAIPQEYGFYGSADLRHPAFHAQYENGNRITKMKYSGFNIISGKPKLNGLPSTYVENEDEAQTLEIYMSDEVTGLKLIYRYCVFSKLDVITRNVEIINGGTNDINIKSAMSFSLDFEECDFEFLHLCGAPIRERYIERVPLYTGEFKIESRRGASSHHHSPFFSLVRKNTDENNGEAYGFCLVYSGNFAAGAEVDTQKCTRVYMGINSFDFNWLLKSGEQFTTPEVIMVYSDGGLNKMSNTYHELFRKRLCRGKYRDSKRPVLINNWEATYFDFDEDKIVEIAKQAKDVGIELMVLDDGWFGVRNDDKTSLGDWYANKKKLPNGISGLAKRINDLGMKFGLWFEPEMVSEESELYKKHPDWCIHVEGREKSKGRNQFILDLSRDDVCEYIIKFMSENLTLANISYVKWDMNRNMTEIGSSALSNERQQETAHRYMLGLYKVLDVLTKKFPDVLFEGCASGGGRFDAGMLYYFPQYWTSDNTDAGVRMFIQHGTSIIMPAVTMGAHVSAVPNHQTGRSISLKTRGYTAMCGTFGYELDITKMTEEEKTQIKEQVEFFKSIRDVIHNGRMFRVSSPFDSDITAWEYISEDTNTVVLFTFVTRFTANLKPTNIKLVNLDNERSYKCRGDNRIFAGSVLNKCGIPIDTKTEYNAEVFVFDKII